jgi:hypothetical protein
MGWFLTSELSVTDAACEIDFRAMVDPSMALDYAKKHFAPELHTVIR